MINEDELVAREELLRLLEERSGRPLRSRGAVRRYLDELAQHHAAASRLGERWRAAKTMALGILGVLALLQYYFLDIMVQVVSVPQLTVFVRIAQVL